MALPTRLGQHIHITENSSSDIQWKSIDHQGNTWFSAKFSLYDFKAVETSDEQISTRITKLFKACARQDSEFLSQWKGQKIETQLDFDRNWGLGSSSSLIYCLSEWADVSPYQLLMDTFGGSGYDIACAGADGPILYQIKDYVISVSESSFEPSFSDQLFFVHLGKKQDSQEAVKNFKKNSKFTSVDIEEASRLTKEFESCGDIVTFKKIMAEHEMLVGKILDKTPIKLTDFGDFNGCIKSLGAWGGDFVLAASEESEDYVKNYFNTKGLIDVVQYDQLILKRN